MSNSFFFYEFVYPIIFKFTTSIALTYFYFFIILIFNYFYKLYKLNQLYTINRSLNHNNYFQYKFREKMIYNSQKIKKNKNLHEREETFQNWNIDIQNNIIYIQNRHHQYLSPEDLISSSKNNPKNSLIRPPMKTLIADLFTEQPPK